VQVSPTVQRFCSKIDIRARGLDAVGLEQVVGQFLGVLRIGKKLPVLLDFSIFISYTIPHTFRRIVDSPHFTNPRSCDAV
jgi:hypothetical protein